MCLLIQGCECVYKKTQGGVYIKIIPAHNVKLKYSYWLLKLGEAHVVLINAQPAVMLSFRGD